MTPRRAPVATYRVQFSRSFPFTHARDLVPYLHELGITDLYASPCLQARRGSSHGYDVADPLRLNSELGTEDKFDELVEQLQHHDMGLLLDIVPNHMAASAENPWWMDVLENGPSSPYASYFDIDWHPATTKAAFLQEHKILLPVLDGTYGKVLENQQLSLELDQNGFFIRYFETRVPLEPKSHRLILAHCLGCLRQSAVSGSASIPEVSAIAEAIERLPSYTTQIPQEIEARRLGKEQIQQRLRRLYLADLEFRRCLEETLRFFNGTAGEPKSFDPLDHLLANQPYRLAHWKIAAEESNYRRFFDINNLVSLQVTDPQVFDARHARILQLVKEGKVTGLRVDHIDGLYDPLGYLHRLQDSVAASLAEGQACPFYVVVEKILGGDEVLPEEWPTSGTTGYDFLHAVNGVFLDAQGLRALEATYTRFTGSQATFADTCYQRKKQVMEQLFRGEIYSLTHALGKLAAQDRDARDLALSELSEALVEATACLPVYRTYIRDFRVRPSDRADVERALETARQRTPPEQVSSSAFAFLQRVLLLHPSHYVGNQKEGWLRFVMRWQQFTGPVMGKGLEDTAFYAHNSLVSLNEVGGDPLRQNLPLDSDAFHLFNHQRRSRWPRTLNATSTHDTKRSEDVRARIDVLAELPEEWASCLQRWSRWNQAKKQKVNGRLVPVPSEEILLYQTMLGAWPLEEDELPPLKQRLQAYMRKAAREAKQHTGWIRPNPEHEGALSHFVEAILEGSGANRFLRDFTSFQRKIAHCGALNSLSGLLLKIASPGVPDFYQGTELWNFSLVDPDNRRAVDFQKRAQLLNGLQQKEAYGLASLTRQLLAHWPDGRIKLYLTWKALNFRRAQRELFSEGNYLSLECTGKSKKNVCAFARRYGQAWAVVAVPRMVTRLVGVGRFPLGRAVWRADGLRLPSDAPQRWVNVLTGEAVEVSSVRKQKLLRLHSLFRSFPVALLAVRQEPAA